MRTLVLSLLPFFQLVAEGHELIYFGDDTVLFGDATLSAWRAKKNPASFEAGQMLHVMSGTAAHVVNVTRRLWTSNDQWRRGMPTA